MAQDIVDEIKAAVQKCMRTFNSGDPTAVSQLHTEDCKVMPPGSDVLVGREAVVKYWSGVMKTSAKKILLTTDEIGQMDSTGTVVFERGHYTFLKEDGSTLDHGKYTDIWKKLNGTWYVYIDIFNSNRSS